MPESGLYTMQGAIQVLGFLTAHNIMSYSLRSQTFCFTYSLYTPTCCCSDIISLFISWGFSYTTHRHIFTEALGNIEDVNFPLVVQALLNDRDVVLLKGTRSHN